MSQAPAAAEAALPCELADVLYAVRELAAPEPDSAWAEIAAELQALQGLIAQVRDLAGEAAGREEPLAADPTSRRRLVDISSHLRRLRTRLQDASDRLREEPEAEAESAALDCIVQDHLEPALASLRCLLHRCGTGEAA